MKMLNNGLGAEDSQHHAHQYSDHGLRRWGRATFGTSHVHPNVQPKSTKTTTSRTGPRPWPSTRTGPTLVNKGYKNSVVPPIVLVPCVANVEALSVANVEVPNANAP